MEKTCTWIEGPAVLVYGDIQDIRIMVVNLLGTIGMMGICIHKGNLYIRIFLPDSLHHDRLIIDITEAPGTMYNPEGMVAGRPDYGKGLIHLSLQYQFCCPDGSTGRNEMGSSRYCLHIRDTDIGPEDILCSGNLRFVFYNSLYIQ